MLHLNTEDLRLLKKILKEHIPNYEVWAYGSRVTGVCHTGSDLDLVIKDEAHPLKQKQLLALITALSESDLPILIDILNWTALPSQFKKEIEKFHELFISGNL